MKVHATGSIKQALPTEHGWDIVKVASESNPNKLYTVDVTFGRCDCPAWKFQKVGADGIRKPCKHLKALGFRAVLPEAIPEQMILDIAEPKKDDGTNDLSITEVL